jgi:hypothetical protein
MFVSINELGLDQTMAIVNFLKSLVYFCSYFQYVHSCRCSLSEVEIKKRAPWRPNLYVIVHTVVPNYGTSILIKIREMGCIKMRQGGRVPPQSCSNFHSERIEIRIGNTAYHNIIF